MPLTVLSDGDVRSILHTLSRDDVLEMQDNLAEALHEYSTGTQESTGCCSQNQPQRISIPSNGGTTLFMPARTGRSTGIKIVSLSSPPSKDPPHPSRQSSAAQSIASSSSSIAPSLAPSAGPSVASSQTTTPRGCLALLSATGSPVAFINAEELTAFRTALAATILFRRRQRTHTIAVFGAGKQAYWHIRLALILRGHDIHHVRIISRSFDSAGPLLKHIYTDPDWVSLRESNDKLDFTVLSSDYVEYTRLLKEYVRDADAIFCCTPSTSPLFPAEHLTSHEGGKKGRYISMIGSYKPHMVEIHPDVLKQAVAPEHKNHHHKHAEKSGVIIVDGLEACLKEAGEVIQAGIHADQLVEIGELIMVKKAVMRELEMGGEGEKGLKRWLLEGNVIYKSVGLGLMDLTVAEDLVSLANDRGYGIKVDEF